MEPEFTFTYEENAPVQGMWTFRASFTETISNTPSARRAYAPIVERIAAWCEDRFGKPSVTACWDYSRMGVFYFEDAMAAFEFRMAWC